MSTKLVFRNGETLSEEMLQRVLGIRAIDYALPATSIGSGYTAGQVGRKNGPTGSDPNHFAIFADGTTMVVTARGGWVLAASDKGASSFDPRGLIALSGSVLSATVLANATGSTRNDTVCLRVDMTSTPAADGSNLVSLVIVKGATGGAHSNAPADGAIYIPLANIAVPNAAAHITQAEVTDLRILDTTQRAQYLCRIGLSTTSPSIAAPQTVIFDQAVDDPEGMFSPSGHSIIVPVAGIWMISASGAYFNAQNPATARMKVRRNNNPTDTETFILEPNEAISQGAKLMRLAAGDHLTLVSEVQSTNCGFYGDRQATWLQAYLVAPS